MSHTTAYPFSEKRRLWYILSLILIIPGTIALFVFGLNIGIDFRGGSLLELRFSDSRPAIETLREKVAETSIPGASVQTAGENGVLVRFPTETGRVAADDAQRISDALDDLAPLDASKQRFETVGGSVAGTTTRNAAIAVALTALAITAYVAWSFRGVPRPASSWRFGITTIIALLHDLLFVIGAFALLGFFFHSLEVDALFITALLTVMGFSVNDTIVVFDRLRENLRRFPGRTFAENADASLSETLARSLNTSGTILIVLITLLVLGGDSIRSFILALTLGVAVGTYSSIFTATPLLVSWQLMADRKPATPKKKK